MQQSVRSIPKRPAALLALLPIEVIQEGITSDYPASSQARCRKFATTEHGSYSVFCQVK